MTEVTVARHSHLVDPQLHIWGWEVAVYLFLGGLVAGLLVFTALQALQSGGRSERSRVLRWSPFLAVVLLSVGMFALLLDLEYKLHVWRFYAAFRPTSAMSWGSWVLVLIYPAALGLGLAGLTDAELGAVSNSGPVRAVGLSRTVERLAGAARRHFRTLVWSNLGLGLALGAYTGILLGTLAVRPLWNTGVLGPLFLVSGVSTGAALLLLFPLSDQEYRWLQRWDVGALVAELALLGLLLATLATNGGAAGRHALQQLLDGVYAGPFWPLVVFAGLVVPLTLELTELRRHRPRLWLTPTLVLLGGFALRCVLVFAGQA